MKNFLSDYKSLAKAISLVENNHLGAEDFLLKLPTGNTPIIGITGPPGAGKSSLINALIGNWLLNNKKIGLVLVDPSSPFNFGALLGDRLRMSSHFTHPNLYIRSVASRGSLGGLSDRIIEILEVMKAADFDYIIVETVGVGQSEVEIAGLADVTVVVLVPESGDSIQAMKAGLMEIADLFCVNKADRDQADHMVHSLQTQLMISHREVEVLKTVAVESKGIEELSMAIQNLISTPKISSKKVYLFAQKAMKLIQQNRTKDLSTADLMNEVKTELKEGRFHFYRFVKKYLS